MKVRTKLLLILTIVALGPLGIATISILGVHQAALEAQVVELQRTTARHAATSVEAYMDRTGRTLTRLGATIQWSSLTSQERAGALWLIFHEVEDAIAVSLVDQGGETAAVAFNDGREATARKPALSQAALDKLNELAPLLSSGADIAFGQPFTIDGLDAAIVVAAARVDQAAKQHVLRVALSLRSLCAEIRKDGAGGVSRTLLDSSRREVCSAQRVAAFSVAPAEVQRAIARGAPTLRFKRSGHDVVASLVATPIGWSIIAEQPVATAFAPSDRIRRLTVFFLLITAIVALLAGTQLAGLISGPLRRLAHAAGQYAEGHFDYRVGLAGRDELAELGAAFDRMGAEIEARDDEIGAWNAELRSRVLERTADLERAHAHIEQTQRVAALTRLAAGLASRINNPLTGVLGILQLVHKRDTAHSELLGRAVDEALRIRTIMKHLLALSQRVRQTDLSETSLVEVVASTLKLVEHGSDAERVRVVSACDRDEAVVRGAVPQLQQALVHLIHHGLRRSVGSAPSDPDDADIEITIAVDGAHACIEVASPGVVGAEQLELAFEPFLDHGDDGSQLGLAMAHRVVEEHDGTIVITSSEDVGTVVTVRLPRVPDALRKEASCVAA